MIESYKNSEQITSPDKFEEDILAEKSIRPCSFNDFIGQNETVENLKVYIEAAMKRDEALDHVLLFGPPGLGKTTLAGIISKISGSKRYVPALIKFVNSVPFSGFS